MSEALRILLVEDDPGDARLIEESMNESDSAGFEFHRAESIMEMDEFAAHPLDAILLDLALPDSSGVETVIKAKATRPDVPIVVLSGLDDREASLEAIRSGAQDFLVKGDVDAATLTRTIRYAIGRQEMVENPLGREHSDAGSLQVVRDPDCRSRAVLVHQRDRRNAIFELVRQSLVDGPVVLVTFDRPYTVWKRRFDAEAVEGVKFIEVIQRDVAEHPEAICIPSPTLLEAVGLKLRGLQKMNRGPMHVIVDSLNIVGMYNNLAATNDFAERLTTQLVGANGHVDFVVVDTKMGDHLLENVGGSVDQVIRWDE